MEKSLHSQKVTEWCAFSAKGIIGLFWFQNQDGSTATITKERCTTTFNRFSKRLQAQHQTQLDFFWFQQDGTTAYISNIALEWLETHFCARVISRKRRTPGRRTPRI